MAFFQKCPIASRAILSAFCLRSRTVRTARAHHECPVSKELQYIRADFLHALTLRSHALPSCKMPVDLLYFKHGPQSPSSLVSCCDFRDGAERPFHFACFRKSLVFQWFSVVARRCRRRRLCYGRADFDQAVLRIKRERRFLDALSQNN